MEAGDSQSDRNSLFSMITPHSQAKYCLNNTYKLVGDLVCVLVFSAFATEHINFEFLFER